MLKILRIRELCKYSEMSVTKKVSRKFMKFVLVWRGFVCRVIDKKVICNVIRRECEQTLVGLGLGQK